MVVARNRPQPPQSNMCLRCAHLDANVRNIKRHLDPVTLELPAAVTCRTVESRIDGRKSGAREPGGGFALRVKRCLQVYRRYRQVVIKLDIIFAAPNHLDGLTQLFRQNSSFDREVAEGFASEASTQQSDVADHVRLPKTQNL